MHYRSLTVVLCNQTRLMDLIFTDYEALNISSYDRLFYRMFDHVDPQLFQCWLNSGKVIDGVKRKFDWSNIP